MLKPSRIPLQVPTFGDEEADAVNQVMRSGYLTMGSKVREFEAAWAKYCGRKHGIMVNSGSSANLVVLTALRITRLWKDGYEVHTPALTWATALFPIVQAGMFPVLEDVEAGTWNMPPVGIFNVPVALLGNPADIMDDATIPLLLDACEAHGAMIGNRNIGSFGLAATFSFFFSHHITTIEGGMIVTNDDDLAEVCRSLRAFGWARENRDYKEMGEKYPDIDPRFLFLWPGYNVRPTEIQAVMGLCQLPKLEGLIAKRRENAAYWNGELDRWNEWLFHQTEAPGTRHSWFAYPLMVKPGAPFTRKDLQDFLESKGVETRPIEAGNMALQPAMQYIKHRVAGKLPNANYIHHNAFFWGAGVTEQEREVMAGYVDEFCRRY